MPLRFKLLDPREGVVLYGTTPPRRGASRADVLEAAAALASRAAKLPLDGFIVYDVQDESARNPTSRPFPFAPTMDSAEYAAIVAGASGREAVCYKALGEMREREWRAWLGQAPLPVVCPVGRPTAAIRGITLLRAIEIAARTERAVGGVAIAERHRPERREGLRMLAKQRAGCGFFVTQTIYDAQATVRMLCDYARACRQASVAPARVVLAFAPCGGEKTLAFLKWLGVSVPPPVEAAILGAASPLDRSIEICSENLRRILDAADGVPLGVAVESISRSREAIAASLDLVVSLRAILSQFSLTYS